MRRQDRVVPAERAREILEVGEYAVLELVDADGEPYGVPLSYAVEGDRAFFHGTTETSHKLDAIRANPRASLTVVMNTEVHGAQYSTAFDSVIAFGPIRPAHDDTEKRMGLMALLGKYSSMVPPERAMRYLEAQLDRTSVIVMDLERVTGKHHA